MLFIERESPHSILLLSEIDNVHPDSGHIEWTCLKCHSGDFDAVILFGTCESPLNWFLIINLTIDRVSVDFIPSALFGLFLDFNSIFVCFFFLIFSPLFFLWRHNLSVCIFISFWNSFCIVKQDPKDEILDQMVKSNQKMFSLFMPMKDCPPTQLRRIFMEGDLKLRDNVKDRVCTIYFMI